ncbi:hypothetical protein T11_9813 [Trichinella zimbabwensis]|uniref:Uncharacterized protein n=1 Tax=Trichinella zimbabwensis TaxID=268475 RepID=A0A0V1I5X8_9BILA|nr:hypothetical protein T11_9813 [Trichinella zimbabwensis]
MNKYKITSKLKKDKKINSFTYETKSSTSYVKTVTCCHYWSAGLTPFQDYHVGLYYHVLSTTAVTNHTAGTNPNHINNHHHHSNNLPSYILKIKYRIAGGSCDALFICSRGATQGQRHRARRRTESSEEPVGTWKYHKTTNQQRRRYSLSSSQDSQGVVHNVNTVADLVGAGRNLVMGQGPSGKSDENWSYSTPVP